MLGSIKGFSGGSRHVWLEPHVCLIVSQVCVRTNLVANTSTSLDSIRVLQTTHSMGFT